MPDKKLTDAEIIKALECCSKGVHAEVCEKCAFRNEDNKININCFNLEKYALDLINRLQAENERLKIENAELKGYKTTDWLIRGISPEQLEHEKIQAWKAEAYKEFAERLKERPTADKDVQYVFELKIDNLLKELVGDTDA